MMVMLVCMVATALLLQGLFDASDHGKAERIVRNYRGAGGPSVGELVESEAPGGEWSSEITHACRGFVRVHYILPSGGRYLFDYDVPQHQIHPANPPAAAVLARVPAAPPKEQQLQQQQPR